MARSDKLKTVEQIKYENEPRKRGRPRKTFEASFAVEKTVGEKRADYVQEQKLQAAVGDERHRREEYIVENYQKLLPTYLEEREQQFKTLLERFKVENDVIIKTQAGKVKHFQLTSLLSKPLFFGGINPPKYTAYDIITCSECYWRCIDEANDTFLCIPTLQQFCRLLGISTGMFIDYKNHQDPAIRNAVAMVYDRFIDFYTTKGLQNEMNAIMSIFSLKSVYGLRDNDTAPAIVNNFNMTVPSTTIDEIEKKYNLNEDPQDVIDLEV